MADLAEQTIPVPPPDNLDGSGSIGHATVDPQNPWPGPDAYDEASRDFFKGRDAEARELLRLIRAAPLTVLYSKSGLGKTSLLQAGLFPLLRREHYLPVPLRLDFAQTTVIPPLEQVMQRLIVALKGAGADYPQPESGEGIWEYLHRKDAEFWSADNFPLVPVLIFDQFEELFSRSGGNAQLIRQVFNDLADLIENRIPAEVASETAGARRSRLDLLTQHYRVLLSFREDYLPDVRTWEKQVPSLLRNTLRLDPMTRECAIRAVEETGKAVLEPDVAPYIVDFVGRREQAAGTVDTSDVVIEPVLLSLCCTQLNLRRVKGARIDIELVKNAGQDILESFYRAALEDPDVKGEPDVAHFIETYLIQGDHFRGDYPKQEALDEHKLRETQLSALTDRIRLVRIVYRSDTARIELIHDRLVPVVRKARDQRQALEAQAERDKERAYNAELVRQRDKANRNLKWAAALALLSLILAGLAALKGVQFRQLKTHATVGWDVERLAGGRLAMDAKDPLDEMGYRALAVYRLSQKEKNLREAAPASLSALNIVLGKYVHLYRIVRFPGMSPTPAISYSPDGKSLAIGTESGVVQILDLATMKMTRTLDCQPRGKEAAWDLAFNSDGSKLAVGYSSEVVDQPGSGMVCVFDLASSSYRRWSSHEHGGPAADVFSVALGGKNDGEYVIFGGSEHVLRKWDLATQNVLEMPQSAAVVAVAINSNGQRVATGGDDGMLKVWNVADLGDATKQPMVLAGHQAVIQQIAFSPVNPDRLISAGDDGRIMAWNVAGGCRTDESKLQDARIETVAINADGMFLASGGADGYVRMFKLPAVIGSCEKAAHKASAAADSEKSEFDVIPEGLLSGHGGMIWGVAFGPDGDQLASAGQDGSVRIWVRNSGSFSLAALRIHSNDAIKDVRNGAPIVPGLLIATAITPDSKSIVAGDGLGNLYVWDRPPETGAPSILEPNVAWKAHDGPIRGLVCLRNGSKITVISAGDDDVIRRWDLATHQEIGADLPLKSVWAMALSPDGKVLAAATRRGAVQLWDPVTGAAGAALPPTKTMGTAFALSGIAFTSDGKYLALSSKYFGSLLIRDPARPDWDHQLFGQNMGTTGVAHGKGAWLLSSGVDGGVLEWEAAALQRPPSTGLRVENDFTFRMGTPGFRAPDSIVAMGASADGKIILTGGNQGQVQLWDGVSHVLISNHFEGHGTSSIDSVALAPDSSFFVTADNSNILVWPGPERWADILCSKLPWNMSHQRWKEWVSPDVPYMEQCPGLPVWPDPVKVAAK
ncbi:MAG: WD40 repeat domain-containing protein [Acidobacteriaceae bacterium]